jgi:conjugal transfer pilus assembly protein TraV
MKLINISILVALSSLTGCSTLGLGESDYSCKGRPNSPTCMSARDVYQATNYKDSVADYSEHDEAVETVNEYDELSDDFYEDDFSETNNDVVQKENTKLPPVIKSTEKTEMIASQSQYIPRMIGALPVRSKSHVMRIWVAPFEDKTGDLHAPGVVYTEIEGRRWTIGEDFYTGQRQFSPLSKGYRKPGN